MDSGTSPYITPTSNLVDLNKEKEIIPASKWLRFFNLLIDYVAFFILAMILGVIIAVLFGDQGIEYFESVPDIFVGVPLILFYYIACEGVSGRTLGKLITGTKVVNKLGNKASFAQVIGRSIVRFIPFEAFSFLLGDGRGLHDILPKTYVIKCR